MNGCIYRTKDNECELWTDNKHKSFCDDNCTDKHPSNADRIRSLSDEELADWLSTITSTRHQTTSKGYCCSGSTSLFLEWLKEEEKQADMAGSEE